MARPGDIGVMYWVQQDICYFKSVTVATINRLVDKQYLINKNVCWYKGAFYYKQLHK